MDTVRYSKSKVMNRGQNWLRFLAMDYTPIFSETRFNYYLCISLKPIFSG
jgi:hypothetical protein